MAPRYEIPFVHVQKEVQTAVSDRSKTQHKSFRAISEENCQESEEAWSKREHISRIMIMGRSWCVCALL